MVWYGMVAKSKGRQIKPNVATGYVDGSTPMVWYGPTGTQHVQAISKEDKIKLEPSVATGCVDGSTPMVWYGMVWYGMVWYGSSLWGMAGGY